MPEFTQRGKPTKCLRGHGRKKPDHIIECACGCGKKIIERLSGYTKRFAPGHNSRCHVVFLELTCTECGKPIRRRASTIKSERVFCSKGCRSRWVAANCFGSPEYREKKRKLAIKNGNGKTLVHKGGEDHYNWKGGITPKNQKWRAGSAAVTWRNAVYARDNFTCVICRQRGGQIHAHHLNSASRHPELRYTLSNGVTLCVACHAMIHGRKLGDRYQKPVEQGRIEARLKMSERFYG
jgi:HNH endonuclease